MKGTTDRRIDWPTMLIPFGIVIALMCVFMTEPEQSKAVVDVSKVGNID